MDLFFGQAAGWFAAPAIIGTAFFIIRLVLMTTGFGHGHDVDAHDVVLSDHSTDHHSDPSQAFKALSLQSIATFMMGFGWVGLGAYRGWGMNVVESLFLGILGGVAMVWLLAVLLRNMYKLHASGNISINSALNHVGDVYVTVPAAGHGRGQVRVTINNRQRIYNATSTAPTDLPPSTRVRVVEINQDNTLSVSPA